jgi:hypothetical protein
LAPASTTFLPVTVIRSTLLLCQLELTKDLATAEAIRTRTAGRRDRYTLNNNNNNGNAARLSHHQQQHHIGWGTLTNTRQNEKWLPSFWTRHRRYLRRKLVHRFVGLLCLAHLMSDVGTAPLLDDSPSFTSTCITKRQLLFRFYLVICHGVIMIPQVLLIIIVTWNLRRHSHGIDCQLLHQLSTLVRLIMLMLQMVLNRCIWIII